MNYASEDTRIGRRMNDVRDWARKTWDRVVLNATSATAETRHEHEARAQRFETAKAEWRAKKAAVVAPAQQQRTAFRDTQEVQARASVVRAQGVRV